MLPDASRASAARRSSRPRTRSSRCLCVKAYNDWMVEEWCGDSDGRLIPLIIIPLWDAELAAAEVRRNAARGVRGRLLQRDPAVPRPAVDPLRTTGTRSSRPATRPARSSTCTSARRRRCRRRRRTRPPRSGSTLTFGNAMSSLVDWLMSGVLVRFPKLDARLLRGPDRLDPLHPRAGRQGLGGEPGLGRRRRQDPRAAEHLLLPPDVYGCFFDDAHGLADRSTKSASTTSPSRPTTRTPTPRGRTPARSAEKLMGHLARRDHPQARPWQRHQACSTSTFAAVTGTDTTAQQTAPTPSVPPAHRRRVGRRRRRHLRHRQPGHRGGRRPGARRHRWPTPKRRPRRRPTPSRPGRARRPSSGPSCSAEAADLLDERYAELVPLVQAETGATMRSPRPMQVPHGRPPASGATPRASPRSSRSRCRRPHADHRAGARRHHRRHRPPCAGRRRRLHHLVQLPADQHGRQARPGAGHGQHRRGQAGPAGPAGRRARSARSSTRPASRRAWSTSSSARDPRPAEALVASPHVDMVSFTGSHRRRVSASAEVAGCGMKRLLLELGGKGAAHRVRRRRPQDRHRHHRAACGPSTPARSAPRRPGSSRSAASTTSSSPGSAARPAASRSATRSSATPSSAR